MNAVATCQVGIDRCAGEQDSFHEPSVRVRLRLYWLQSSPLSLPIPPSLGCFSYTLMSRLWAVLTGPATRRSGLAARKSSRLVTANRTDSNKPHLLSATARSRATGDGQSATLRPSTPTWLCTRTSSTSLHLAHSRTSVVSLFLVTERHPSSSSQSTMVAKYPTSSAPHSLAVTTLLQTGTLPMQWSTTGASRLVRRAGLC